jgi:hypothetical protein
MATRTASTTSYSIEPIVAASRGHPVIPVKRGDSRVPWCSRRVVSLPRSLAEPLRSTVGILEQP